MHMTVMRPVMRAKRDLMTCETKETGLDKTSEGSLVRHLA